MKITKLDQAVNIFKGHPQKTRKEVIDIMIHRLNMKPYLAKKYYRDSRNIVLQGLRESNAAHRESNEFNLNSAELMKKLGLGDVASISENFPQQTPKSITIRFEF